MVRSVKKEHGNETRVGVYIGSWYDDDPESRYNKMGNSVFFVLDIDTFVRGFESWWKNVSRKESQAETVDEVLKNHDITNEVIQASVKRYVESAVEIGKQIEEVLDSRAGS